MMHGRGKSDTAIVEAGEQGGANRCGTGGAKGGGQGECVPAGRSSALALRTRGKSRMHQRARTDLRGGRGVIPAPTATYHAVPTNYPALSAFRYPCGAPLAAHAAAPQSEGTASSLPRSYYSGV
jgi:hypothetical protein